MKSKLILIAGLVAVVGAVALAGFDQYNSKNYKTCLSPTFLADDSTAITNSITTGVDIMGLPGNGCMVFSYQCNNTAASILKFRIATCATTNGSYVVYTNSDGAASWSYTNAAGFGKVLFRPNCASRFLRVYVTPTLVTNGVAGAVLATE